MAERWRAAVAEVEAESPTLGSALKQATLRRRSARPRCASASRRDTYPAMVERKRAAVEKAFSAFLGRPVKLAIEMGPAQPRPPASRAGRLHRRGGAGRAGGAAVQGRGTRRATHPNIQEAAKLLDAEIDGTDEL